MHFMTARTAHARALFAPLGPTYDRVGAVLSLGQDPLWRRFLVGRLPGDGGHVLDVATGTGLVAEQLLRRGFRVTGLDQSPDMLDVARRRLAGRAELVRVVRPGGTIVSLEFGVPRGPARPLWDAYVGLALPLAGRLLGQGWHEVGTFLGGSIREFWKRHPLPRQLELWLAAGVRDLEVRRLSLGGAVVIWGRRA
jgi:demethylmenaquinone methyltransferase/2-methoxy-6-polyprenyl-1,4-benzoquinol methylase